MGGGLVSCDQEYLDSYGRIVSPGDSSLIGLLLHYKTQLPTGSSCKSALVMTTGSVFLSEWEMGPGCHSGPF